MTPENLPNNASDELQQLLCRRPDVWRGYAGERAPLVTVSTGFAALDEALACGGWPTQCLIDVAQGPGHAEWHVLGPTLTQTKPGFIVLINPPTRPFAPAAIQLGVDLDRLIVVEANQKTEWMTAVLQVARTEACQVLMAWQPKQALSYTELRKCQLAAADRAGLTFLFRPESTLQHASPAALRLRASVVKQNIAVSVVKQRGTLGGSEAPIQLPLPKLWCGGFLYQTLNRPTTHPVWPLRTQRGRLRSV